MIMYSDEEYKATKQIILGKKSLNPDFLELADFIDHSFGVKTINIIYDEFGDDKRPRLNICFETAQEKRSFDNKSDYNFNSRKQKLIAAKFAEIYRATDEKYNTNDVWVYYSAFEPIARSEANESIPLEKVAALKEELGNKDLWEISRLFWAATFFVYTDKQKKLYENSDERKAWANKYFDLLEPYNQFGYFKRDTFHIYLDSKENFDNHYQSNWYYYYK